MIAYAGTALVLLVAGALATGSRERRTSALLVSMLAIAVPLVAPSLPVLRFVAGIAAVVGVARVLDLVREPVSRPLAGRLFQVLVVVDWRTATRAPRRFHGPLALRGLAYSLLALGASCGVVLLRAKHAPLALAWPFAAVMVWAMAEAGSRIVVAFIALFGWRVPPLHDRPLASRTLGELWGKRWNLTVTHWLKANVFSPLARTHRARLGVLGAFVVSALFHAYIAFAGGGVCALLMGSFFVVQALLVITERLLRVARWPTPLARVWMLACMLLPSPLFTEPVIAIAMPGLSPLQRQAERASMPSFAKLGT